MKAVRCFYAARVARAGAVRGKIATTTALACKRQQGQPTSHPPLGFLADGSRESMVPGNESLRRRFVTG